MIKTFFKIIGVLLGTILLGSTVLAAGINANIGAQQYMTKSGVNIVPIVTTYEFGSTTRRWAKGWFTDLDVSGIFTFGGVMGSNLHFPDDLYGTFGNTAAAPDARLGWNTAQTVDGLYLGTATGQNTLIIAENGDVAYDFANGAQTHPTIFLQSANQTATEKLRLNYANIAFLGAGLAATATEYEIGRNADATNDLFLNVPTGATISWRVNGVEVSAFTSVALYNNIYSNLVTINNAQLQLNTTGSVINRDVADANITLIVDRINAAATGDVTEFRAASSPVLSIDGGGGLIFDGAAAAIATNYEIRRNADATNRLQLGIPTGALGEFSVNDVFISGWSGSGFLTTNILNPTSGNNSRIQLTTTGTIIDHNVADANVAVTIQQINASSTGSILELSNDTTTVLRVRQGGGMIINPEAQTSGTPDILAVNGAAHTGITAATEIIDIDFALNRSLTWAAGAGPLAQNRSVVFRAPTLVGDAAGALTITDAATIFIDAAPTQGANMTLTNRWGVWIDNANIRLDGLLEFGAAPSAGTSTTRYQIYSDAASLVFNIRQGARFVQQAQTSGVPTAFLITGAAHTALTASTEDIGINFNMSATKQWATGALTLQREFVIQAPTFAFVGPSTLTGALTANITGLPIIGANATFTDAVALGVGSFGTTELTSVTGDSTELLILMPGIANGIAAVSDLTGLAIGSSGATISLGNQTSTLDSVNGIVVEALTYVSTTNVRTVTEMVGLRVNAPIASTNVATLNGPYALLVDSGKVRIDGGGGTRHYTQEGAVLDIQSSTVNSPNANETLAIGATERIGITTFTNDNATLTFTNMASLYIQGIPVASTNVAFSNTALALWVDSGTSRFDGNVQMDIGAGTSQLTIDGSTGGCIMLRDTDDAGWTEVDALDGALTATIDADGLCD